MIEEGVAVNYPENMDAFKEATRSIHDQFVGTDIDPALYEKTLEILAE